MPDIFTVFISRPGKNPRSRIPIPEFRFSISGLFTVFISRPGKIHGLVSRFSNSDFRIPIYSLCSSVARGRSTVSCPNSRIPIFEFRFPNTRFLHPLHFEIIAPFSSSTPYTFGHCDTGLSKGLLYFRLKPVCRLCRFAQTIHHASDR